MSYYPGNNRYASQQGTNNAYASQQANYVQHSANNWSQTHPNQKGYVSEYFEGPLKNVIVSSTRGPNGIGYPDWKSRHGY